MGTPFLELHSDGDFELVKLAQMLDNSAANFSFATASIYKAMISLILSGDASEGSIRS